MESFVLSVDRSFKIKKEKLELGLRSIGYHFDYWESDDNFLIRGDYKYSDGYIEAFGINNEENISILKIEYSDLDQKDIDMMKIDDQNYKFYSFRYRNGTGFPFVKIFLFLLGCDIKKTFIDDNHGSITTLYDFLYNDEER
ncbi:hypothetical protein GCM10009007_21010 [Formosimonas limnophila]|uniref:Uncharacterized protein n=1 Tax=Formosimonas limnophila TaxID=1384487 RepID=A0A8J3G0U1_9BURK|nr:hypothetical protein [Formosimonas limnophila]GHA79893.1 hypothetical protein GCM10009007_21010 [Formosimonas limnophila]